MSLSNDSASGLYVYAFLRSGDEHAIPNAGLRGIDDADVFAVAQGSLAVAVSRIESKKIRPQRKYMAAHQDVVTLIARNWSMLPVSFGLIADDLEQVNHILHANEDVLNDQIDRVDGQVEMAVSLRWTAENVPQYFVDRYPALSEARELIVAGNASRDDQIEMGRMFEKLLTSERDAYTQKFLDILGPICKEVDVQPVRQEADVMKLACLINKSSEQQFNDAVYKGAEMFSDDFSISFNGPWPPYSFVKLALSME